MASVLAATIVTIGAIGTANAYDKLPKAAVPMADDQVKKIYSDHTNTYQDGHAIYLSPKGSVIGVGLKGDSYAEGTWAVAKGQMCTQLNWIGIDAKATVWPIKNCWDFKVAGKKVFHRFTSDRIPSEDGYWSGPLAGKKELVMGNSIEALYEATKAKAVNKL